MPEPQVATMWKAGISMGKPALTNAIRATLRSRGSKQFPSITWPTIFFSMPAFWITDSRATVANETADTSFSEPPKAPIGVLVVPHNNDLLRDGCSLD